MRRVWEDVQRNGVDRGCGAQEAVFKKTRDEAMRLAALGLSYASVGEMLRFAKSTLCKCLKQEKRQRSEISGAVLEMDGVWTRMRVGKAELKVVRDETSAALGTFGSWEDALDDVYAAGVESPTHIVSDRDGVWEWS